MAHSVNGHAIFFDDLDLSCDTGALNLAAKFELKADDVMCEIARRKLPGLDDGDVSLAGMGDMGDGMNIDKFFANLGPGKTSKPFTAAVNHGVNDSMAFFVKLLESNLQMGGNVGEVFVFTLTGPADGAVVKGRILLPKTAVVASGVGTERVLGAADTTKNLYGSLHVFAASMTSLDCLVQSAAATGMGSPTTRLTFAQKTDVGSEHKVVPVTVSITDTYWQFKYTLVGASCTIAAVFGIQTARS